MYKACIDYNDSIYYNNSRNTLLKKISMINMNIEL